jgi:hypothetical protein
MTRLKVLSWDKHSNLSSQTVGEEEKCIITLNIGLKRKNGSNFKYFSSCCTQA